MSFISTLVADLKWAATHPSTVRKELVAVASSVSADIVAFNTLIPNLPGPLQATVAGVQGLATFILTFLAADNAPKR